MKYIISGLILGLMASVAAASFHFGYKEGFAVGSTNGYSKGQVDLALEVTKEIGETVNNEKELEDYKHFKDIHDITLYIFEKNGVKTVAIWE